MDWFVSVFILTKWYIFKNEFNSFFYYNFFLIEIKKNKKYGINILNVKKNLTR